MVLEASFSDSCRPIHFLPALVILLLIAGPAPGTASDWVWQNPLPQGNALNDVYFADAQTGLAVGGGGTIIRTTDGGQTWVVLSSGTETNLRGVYLIDDLNGVAVGNEGLILRTTDGGNTWSPKTSGTTGTLLSVYMINGERGFISGWGSKQTDENLLRTRDGGDSWLAVSSGTTLPLEEVAFADASTGVAVGWSATIVRTVDGGDFWTLVTENTFTGQLFAVTFADANTGLAVGRDGEVLQTVNGGLTWIPRPIATSNWLRGVVFLDAETAVAAGLDLFRSIDSGVTWSVVNNPAGVALMGVARPAGGCGVVVGTDGAILGSNDAGLTWMERRSGYTGGDVSRVHFTDPSTGIAVAYSNGVSDGGAKILHTSDSGANWSVQPAGSVRLVDLSFSDALNGVVVGDSGSVVTTVDGGVNWSVQSSGVTVRLNGVSMADANTGTVVGMNGVILRTVDGGAGWSPQASGTDEPLWDVCFTDANHGVAVGDYVILRTTDGGTTWLDVPHAMSNAWLYGVDFADADNGLAVGDFSTILRTTDGGVTWTTQLSTGDDAEVLWSVAFADVSNAVVVGWPDRGRVNCLRTTDGGTSWVPEPTGVARHLLDVYYDGTMATVVGFAGAILRSETGTVAVVLQAFDSCWKQNRVEVTWRLIDASGELSFDITRARGSQGTFQRMPEYGVHQQEDDFIYEDHTAEPGETYRYRVAIKENGDRVASFETQVNTLAGVLSLRQNHPNPFNPTTQIPFVIDTAQHVTLSIYDTSGRLIRTLVDLKMKPGNYSEKWDGFDERGSQVSSGVYFYRLTVGKKTLSKKALLLK